MGSFGENPQSGGGGAEEKGGLAKVVQFLNKLGQSLMESHNLERIKKNSRDLQRIIKNLRQSKRIKEI